MAMVVASFFRKRRSALGVSEYILKKNFLKNTHYFERFGTIFCATETLFFGIALFFSDDSHCCDN